MRNNKGQNLAEYILLVVAVLIVCIYFFANQSHGPMGTSLNAGLNSMVTEIDNINSQININ